MLGELTLGPFTSDRCPSLGWGIKDAIEVQVTVRYEEAMNDVATRLEAASWRIAPAGQQ